MPAISKGMLRDIKAILVCVHEGEGTVQASTVYDAMEAIDRALTPKRSLAPAAKRRASKAELRAEKISAIRGEVWERSSGSCENCTTDLNDSEGDLDHAFGGSGRRRTMEAVTTCWRLCRTCHQDKTNNLPDAAHWWGRFAKHCKARGYSQTALEAEKHL